jgi:nucleoside-diphosphate-sugar epimerase
MQGGSIMRCLVSGAAGFIGSHLVERLLEEGHEVVGIDCFTPYYSAAIKRRNLAELHSDDRFRLIEADLATAHLEPLVDRADWVFHLAGQPGVRDSWGPSFEEYVHNNVMATQRFLDVLAQHVPKRLVYASSSSIYGDAPLPMDEGTPPRPLSPYGVTKLAAEHLVHAYGKSFGIPETSLRFFSVYGPRQRPDMAFHRFIASATRGETIHVYGDGTQTRDFTYVDDVVRACLLAARIGRAGEAINVGGGASISVNAAIDHIGALLGHPVRVERTGRQRGDAAHTRASTARARNLLGWEALVPWTEGLRRQLEWQAARASSSVPEPVSV